MLTPLQKHLLNEYQHGFPLTPTPFRDIGEQLGLGEDGILLAFQTLAEQNMISRIGPVIAPNSIGSSALVAMAVTDDDLEWVAQIISSYPEVNHNYERENRFNLWFVLVADDEIHLQARVNDIEQQTGYPAMLLPMLADYFINLGFDLNQDPSRDSRLRSLPGQTGFSGHAHRQVADLSGRLDELDYQLIAAVQQGLPIVAKPYAAIAGWLSIAEAQVIRRLHGLKALGLIKRWGVVVQHRQLGYQANAMIVINVAEAEVDEIGALLSAQACVNLCYQRPRQGEVWPYNLYCMIHGKSRDTVLQQWAALRQVCGLQEYAFEVLFSRRCFKQRGAVYRRRIEDRQDAGFSFLMQQECYLGFTQA